MRRMLWAIPRALWLTVSIIAIVLCYTLLGMIAGGSR